MPDQHRKFCKRFPVTKMEAAKIYGSRNANGNVPGVNSNDGKFNVNYYNPDNSNGNWRFRPEVSAKRGLNLSSLLVL